MPLFHNVETQLSCMVVLIMYLTTISKNYIHAKNNSFRFVLSVIKCCPDRLMFMATLLSKDQVNFSELKTTFIKKCEN